MDLKEAQKLQDEVLKHWKSFQAAEASENKYKEQKQESAKQFQTHLIKLQTFYKNAGKLDLFVPALDVLGIPRTTAYRAINQAKNSANAGSYSKKSVTVAVPADDAIKADTFRLLFIEVKATYGTQFLSLLTAYLQKLKADAESELAA